MPLQIADAVAVVVLKRPRVDLIDHRAAPPIAHVRPFPPPNRGDHSLCGEALEKTALQTVRAGQQWGLRIPWRGRKLY